MPITREGVQRFLETLGSALTRGDAAAVARCWDVPALVLADQGATAVADLAAVERFFARADEHYRSRGLVSTRPLILQFEPLGDRLASVLVRWPAFDAAGVEKSSERSHYLLRLGDDDQPRIRVSTSVSTPE